MIIFDGSCKKTPSFKRVAFQKRVLHEAIQLLGSFALVVAVVRVELVGMVVVIRLMRAVVGIVLIRVIVQLRLRMGVSRNATFAHDFTSFLSKVCDKNSCKTGTKSRLECYQTIS